MECSLKRVLIKAINQAYERDFTHKLPGKAKVLTQAHPRNIAGVSPGLAINHHCHHHTPPFTREFLFLGVVQSILFLILYIHES